MSVKRIAQPLYIVIFIVLAACAPTEKQLKERANELCRYIPDHELLTQSRDYLTEDFYVVLDTMFNHLPEDEELDHEWLYYFVTSNGGTIADYEVQSVEKSDETHAVATVLVKQRWEDGSFDETTDVEEHRLYMELIDGKWLMSDFDEHKADCVRYIAISRAEQNIRDSIRAYLVREIGPHYMQGELCVPTLMVVAEDDCETEIAFVYGDFWIEWYNIAGDTLKFVSGGNHSGRMTISQDGETYYVSAFWQTADGARNESSAKEIFGTHYDVYAGMHANPDVHEACRRLQLQNYIRRHNLNVHYYQDYGQPAKQIL
jgi:hypothetical protein